MRKTRSGTFKMEPTAPKVLSRYLSSPVSSCHDHCKCSTKQPIETKPINLFPRRIPKPPLDRTKVDASNSVNRIKKTASVIPKLTTPNAKTSTAVKDPVLKKEIVTIPPKKGVADEPKSRDLKPKSENSQAKKSNLPSSRTSRRRYSDIFLPNMLLPSSKDPKRRLSEIGIPPNKDVVSVSNTSLVRGSRIIKNEPTKDSKLSSVNKKSSSVKPTVPASPKRGAKVPTLRSDRSLSQQELKSPRKSKPRKPIEEVVPEKTLHATEPSNGVETTENESHITPDSSSISEEKVMANGDNELQECSPPMEDENTATDDQHNDSVPDEEVIDTNEATQVEKLVETTETENLMTPDSSSSSEEKVMENGDNEVQECSPSREDDASEKDGDQNDDNITDAEVNDTNVATRFEKLVVEITDCSLDDELVFKRGKILGHQSEGSSPRKLQFMQGKEWDEIETEKALNKISLRRFSCDGVIRVPESHSVSVELKHQEIAERECPALFNKVIKETANKLIQTKKSKVKALVGAFENIVSTKGESGSGTEPTLPEPEIWELLEPKTEP